MFCLKQPFSVSFGFIYFAQVLGSGQVKADTALNHALSHNALEQITEGKAAPAWSTTLQTYSVLASLGDAWLVEASKRYPQLRFIGTMPG